MQTVTSIDNRTFEYVSRLYGQAINERGLVRLALTEELDIGDRIVLRFHDGRSLLLYVVIKEDRETFLSMPEGYPEVDLSDKFVAFVACASD